jgi:DDE superfamily endonuclease
MGVISTAKVVTGSERRSRPKAIQPGNREWVTVIQGVNAQGWTIPPNIIFKGEYHLSAWYEEDLPGDWRISLSDKGWTTNEIGFEWIQHFDQHTKQRTIGVYRLLILDGHDSHESLQFQDFCKENNIITLCMPPQSSHLLQPLDVGCFAPLKRAYGRQIEDLSRNYINHITKLEFLPAFKAAFNTSFLKENIQGGF